MDWTKTYDVYSLIKENLNTIMEISLPYLPLIVYCVKQYRLDGWFPFFLVFFLRFSYLFLVRFSYLLIYRKQCGRVVSVSDSQSRGPGFESRSDHYLDLFFGSPEFKSSATPVNSQLVCFRPVGILNNVMFNLNYTCLSCLLGPTIVCAINTAEGK